MFTPTAIRLDENNNAIDLIQSPVIVGDAVPASDIEQSPAAATSNQQKKTESPPSIHQVPIIQGLRGSHHCPKDFLSLNAVEALDVDVPAHVQSRWQQIDEKMRIGELFKSVSRAATALNGFRLKSLPGFKEYSKIKVKQHGDQPGLLQHLKTLGVKGHTTRLKSKGTMFFFFVLRESRKR